MKCVGYSFAHTRLCLHLAKENLKKLQNQDCRYYERVITVNESRIHHYNPKLKHESETWLRKGEQK